MMTRVSVACVLLLCTFTFAAGAMPHDSAGWTVPEEGGVEMFRQGERAFAVGADTGGAGIAPGEVDLLPPGPNCQPIQHSKCAQNVETCSGSCVAYLNYYCKTCDCGSFRFCG